jgi:hypothetical protein
VVSEPAVSVTANSHSSGNVGSMFKPGSVISKMIMSLSVTVVLLTDIEIRVSSAPFVTSTHSAP